MKWFFEYAFPLLLVASVLAPLCMVGFGGPPIRRHGRWRHKGWHGLGELL